VYFHHIPILQDLGFVDLTCSRLACPKSKEGSELETAFHILGRLRKTYPNIRSLMMDGQTLNDLRDLMGPGEKAGAPPSNLTLEERVAFDEVERNGRRLEQEKIPVNYSVQTIARLTKCALAVGIPASRLMQEI
jgi:hypothetical protein